MVQVQAGIAQLACKDVVPSLLDEDAGFSHSGPLFSSCRHQLPSAKEL